MPKPSTISAPALEHIADQQRYTPKKTVLAQLARLESLAQEIDPARSYLVGTISQRITGFAARVDGERTVSGKALLRDLSALAERLCRQASLAPADHPPGSIETDRLAERWSVSRRTVERYRREGLIGRWGVEQGGRLVTVLFAPGHIEWFERAHADRIEGARRQRRVDPEELARGLEIAAACVDEGHSVAEALRRAGAETSCSPSTLRRAWREERGGRGPLTRRDRRLCVRADARGIEPGRIAGRLGRSSATVHRVLLEARLRRLRGLGLTPPDEPPSDDAILAATGTGPVSMPLPAWPDPLPRTASALAAHPSARGVGMTPAAERAFIEARGLLLARAAWLIAGSPRTTPPAGLIDRAETDLRWSLRITWAMVEGVLPAVVRTLRTAGTEPGDALVAAAIDAATDEALSFGPERQGRLAATANLVVTRFVTAGPAEAPATASGAAWHRWVFLFPSVRFLRGLACLETEDRKTLEQHLGMAGESPRTAAELGGARHVMHLRRLALRAARVR